MCKTGNCNENDGGKRIGICGILKGVGQTCESNDDCFNDACGRITAKTDAPLVCCLSGQTKSYWQFDYCTEMPKGSICWLDVMCIDDGDCKGNLFGAQKGICE